MQKSYERINWENYPSDKTPLNETNLNKLDVATNEIDNRVITLDSTKFDKTEASKLIKNFELDKTTGIITITYLSGATVTIDTLLEKLAVNFDFDEATQKIIITLDDGTVKEVDLSSFITDYEFLDSDTVAFTVDTNGKVVAIVKEGSIEEKHLRPNYLADIKVEVAKAQSSATASATSEANAKASEENAKLSENNAKESELNSKTSETSAKDSETKAKTSETASATSASNSKTSETNSKQSETNAQNSATQASNSATSAKTSETNSKTSEINAQNSANKSESYAVGGTGTRTGEDTDNSKYYYQESKRIYEDFNSASDVKGVKGNKETTYRTGLVNLTPDNIGAVSEEEGAELSERIALNKQTLGYSKKNLLPYPYYNTTITTKGVTFTVNDDSSITINGTADGGTAWIDIYHNTGSLINNISINKKYIYSLGKAVTGVAPKLFQWYDGEWNNLGTNDATGLAENSFTLNDNATGMLVRIQISKGNTINNVTVYPMIRDASIEDDTYEPYIADVDTRLNEIEGDYLAKTGDNSNTTTAFTQATTRANITTGEKLSVIMGKISKWFADLKTVAFTGSYNDLSNKPTANDVGAMPSIKLTSSVDFNTLTTTGFYHINFTNGDNKPTTNHGTLIVDFSVGTPYQIWIPDNRNVMYKRYYTTSNSTWSEWTVMDARNADYATKALQDGNGKDIDKTYLPYGGYHGSDTSINDITTVGIHRKWIGINTDDGIYLGLTQSEQVAIIVTLEAGLIKQYIICFGGEGVTSNRMYWRSTNSQTDLTFTYDTPLQTLCYTFTPDVGDNSTRIATTEWVNNGYLSKNGGTVNGTTNINGIRTVAFEVISGTNYLLMYDVTDIWTSDGVTTGFSKRGFSGFAYAQRNSGNLDENTAEINIALSYMKNLNSIRNTVLRTNNPDYFTPCVVYDNTNKKYYLSLKITGFLRNVILQGMFYGDYVGTVATDTTRYTVAYDKYTLLSISPNQILNTATAIEASTSSENIVGVQGLKEYVGKKVPTKTVTFTDSQKFIDLSEYSIHALIQISVKEVSQESCLVSLSKYNGGSWYVNLIGGSSNISLGNITSNGVYLFNDSNKTMTYTIINAV